MNMMDGKVKEVLVGLLRELARQIHSMDAGEYGEMISGTAKLEVRVVGTKKQAQNPKHSRLSDDEMHDLVETLRMTRTRDEGHQLLDQRIRSKHDMARLAKKLDVPVQKSDSNDQIRARVIESTIGFRIRSAAIQGVVGETSNKPAE